MPKTLRSRTAKPTSEKLAGVPEEQRFYCGGGRVLNSLEELESALRVMSDDTFLHHVNESKNDFANWVRDVIGDEKLADDLRKVASRSETARVVASRISYHKG